MFSSTAIGLRKYRIPSDLRSQAEYRLVSTMVGDHMGILGVVVFVSGTLGGEESKVGEVRGLGGGLGGGRFKSNFELDLPFVG